MNFTAEPCQGEVDQTILAEDVSGKIKYEMCKEILVKPLPITKIKRVVQKPVPAAVTNDDGLDITEYDEVETEEIEVDSNFREGIILKVPGQGKVSGQGNKVPGQCNNLDDSFKIGDTIVYNHRFAIDFDILKDTQLVKLYDIIAVKRS